MEIYSIETMESNNDEYAVVMDRDMVYLLRTMLNERAQHEAKLIADKSKFASPRRRYRIDYMWNYVDTYIYENFTIPATEEEDDSEDAEVVKDTPAYPFTY